MASPYLTWWTARLIATRNAPEDGASSGSTLLTLQQSPMELRVAGSALAAHEPLRLSFAIHSSNGTPVRHLKFVHERPLHLLVVSVDLAEFAHIHPTLVAGDRYEVTHTFAHGGRYRLYADYTPPGSAQRITSFVLNLQGKPRARQPLLARAASPHHIQLAASQPLRANTESEFALISQSTRVLTLVRLRSASPASPSPL